MLKLWPRSYVASTLPQLNEAAGTRHFQTLPSWLPWPRTNLPQKHARPVLSLEATSHVPAHPRYLCLHPALCLWELVLSLNHSHPSTCVCLAHRFHLQRGSLSMS